jgi:hypothetical protein
VTIRWSLTNGAAGAITSDGVLTAGTSGRYSKVLVAEGTLDGRTRTATADLTILSRPVEDLVIGGAEWVEVGTASQLTLTDLAGLALPDDFEIEFPVADPAAGSVNSAGLLTAGQVAGTYNPGVSVTARRGEEVLTGSIAVTLVAGPFEGIALSPDAVELGKGERQQFLAVAVDRFGNPVAGVTLAWSVDRGGGTVLSDGRAS